jgi:predicted ATP-grasp superfamily ATP-dependent carboligase
MKLDNLKQYDSWLLINQDIEEFTVSEFLPGRHLANQMLYYDGEYIKGASLECVEYVMANIAPSKITGNTSFGKFINESAILEFCNECIMYICNTRSLKAHGVLSFDLKEDSEGNYKVTEINIRHMAYTGIMAQVGFDLISDTINILFNGNTHKIKKETFYNYDKSYIFLRDVDIEPIVLENELKIPY